MDQVSEASFGANIVGEDEDTTLIFLDAHHCVGSLAVMPALVKSMALRTIKGHNSQAGVKIFALLGYR